MYAFGRNSFHSLNICNFHNPPPPPLEATIRPSNFSNLESESQMNDEEKNQHFTLYYYWLSPERFEIISGLWRACPTSSRCIAPGAIINLCANI